MGSTAAWWLARAGRPGVVRARFGPSVLFQPDAGRVDADATVRALQRGSAAHGADVHFNEGVEAMTATGEGVVVRTGADEYRSPVAVVACGAWAAGVLDGLVPLP